MTVRIPRMFIFFLLYYDTCNSRNITKSTWERYMGKKVINSAAVLLSSALIFSSSAAVEAPFEIGTWGNFCKGAISHTFDDYPTSSTDQQVSSGQAAFDEKGFHMTLFVLPSSCNDDNWNSLKAAFAKGHEIASHNNQHNSNADGLKPSQNAIKSKVPGEMCVSIAYPNCQTPGNAQVLQTYIAGRNCTPNVNPKTPQNFAQIDSKMFGTCSGCPNDVNGLNSFADEAANKNGWGVYCHHGIGSDGHSWAVTNLNAMKEHLNYLDRNRDKIWCETFGNVARYIKERDAASLTVESSEPNQIKVKLTDNLPDSIYNYPLSIRCPLPEWWTATSRVTQDGIEVEDTIINVNSQDYLMFKAVPDGGDILIESGTRVRNLKLASATGKTVLLNKSGLSINAGQFSGSTIAVSLFDLRGKLFARYSLNRSSSILTVPISALTSSAFVVKVTDGNTTVVTRCLAQ